VFVEFKKSSLLQFHIFELEMVYRDPIWKTLKGKELGGGQQTKVAPRGGFAM